MGRELNHLAWNNLLRGSYHCFLYRRDPAFSTGLGPMEPIGAGAGIKTHAFPSLPGQGTEREGTELSLWATKVSTNDPIALRTPFVCSGLYNLPWELDRIPIAHEPDPLHFEVDRMDTAS